MLHVREHGEHACYHGEGRQQAAQIRTEPTGERGQRQHERQRAEHTQGQIPRRGAHGGRALALATGSRGQAHPDCQEHHSQRHAGTDCDEAQQGRHREERAPARHEADGRGCSPCQTRVHDDERHQRDEPQERAVAACAAKARPWLSANTSRIGPATTGSPPPDRRSARRSAAQRAKHPPRSWAPAAPLPQVRSPAHDDCCGPRSAPRGSSTSTVHVASGN